MKHDVNNIEGVIPVSLTDFPSVSLTLPLESGFSRLHDIETRLNSAHAQIKKILNSLYPDEKAHPILEKLAALSRQILPPPDRKGLFIFISPSAQQLLYLHSDVSSHIVVDHALELRNLTDDQQFTADRLVLLLSAEKALLYHWQNDELVSIDPGVPGHIDAYRRDGPTRVSNFTDPDKQKEILLDKFLRHIDEGLGTILKSYPLPVYLIAPQKVAGHFKKITKHPSAIQGWIHGSYTDATPVELLHLLQTDTGIVSATGKALQLDLQTAAEAQTLACVVQQANIAADHKNAKLLLAELDAVFITASELPNTTVNLETDNLIEKVIQCGGQVRIVPHGALEEYGPVAVVRYYRE